MIQQRLEKFLAERRSTLLGVGPMSLNCVDAAIELANEYRVPLMLIASRRQIDSKEFGGGYVNNWDTLSFADYVIDRDKQAKIILARDHGGPWQSENEKSMGLSLRRAMESAKESYRADIDAGFQMLHIDPSIDIYTRPDIDEVLDRIYELYEFCWSYAQRKGHEIIFEIGTEEQNGSTNTQEELEYTLEQMKRFCTRNQFPYPSFVVVQTGTRVMESSNIGSFDSPMRVANELPAEIQAPKMIEICNRYGIFMKVHNTDYLSTDALQWHPRLGIHAANVAPEFGVAETKALVAILEENGMKNLADAFLKASYDSGKWKKWMLPDSTATDRDKAIIAGHYVLASEICQKIKETARTHLSGLNLDEYLKNEVKKSILRYMTAFRLVR